MTHVNASFELVIDPVTLPLDPRVSEKCKARAFHAEQSRDELSADFTAMCECIRHPWGTEGSSLHMGRLGW